MEFVPMTKYRYSRTMNGRWKQTKQGPCLEKKHDWTKPKVYVWKHVRETTISERAYFVQECTRCGLLRRTMDKRREATP